MKSKILITLSVLIVGALAYGFYLNQPKLTYDEYLQQGIDYEVAGDPAMAIDSYELASKVDKKVYVPYSNIGSIYITMEEFDMAEVAFKKALSIDPQAVNVWHKLYELYRYNFKKPPHEMDPFFADALEKTNNNIDIIKLRAFYLEDINDPVPALAIWKAFLEAEPGNKVYMDKIEKLETSIKAQGLE